MNPNHLIRDGSGSSFTKQDLQNLQDVAEQLFYSYFVNPVILSNIADSTYVH
jgi:hypothetical protein